MNKKMRDKLIELSFDDDATATDVIAAVQATDGLSEEDRAKIGTSVELSDEVKLGAKSLSENRSTAHAAYILGVSTYKRANEEFWAFLRNALPELDKWEFTYDEERGQVVIISKRK